MGNPGEKYQKTRHNLGFRVIDHLLTYPTLSISQKKNISGKMEGYLAVFHHQKILLGKPLTFMNESGKAVAAVANFYKIKPQDIIVIYDDIDLPLGTIRVREKGSSGGHKGVQSIIDSLGEENFLRVRIGIGRPPLSLRAEDYVLREFSEKEEKVIQQAVDAAADKVISLI